MKAPLARYEKPSAFLLTWKAENKKWPPSDYQKTLDSAKSGKNYQTEWSTGHSKKLFCGARVFLLKQGKPPTGIMGIGRVVRIPRHQHGHTRTSVFIVVEQMLDYEREPLFDREQLLKIDSNSVWNAWASGNEISHHTATRLEQSWREFTGMLTQCTETLVQEKPAIDNRLSMRLVLHRSREQWKRDDKIAEALRHTNRLACEVPGCGLL